MKRREFITFLGGAVAAGPLGAHAQKSLPRIGWLVYGGATLGPIDQSLKDALAQAGLVDGRNIEIIFRYANGVSDRLAELAAELVAQKPDLPSSVALAITRCGRELPYLLLGQARISPGSRISRMKWRPSA
jgi:putative ABC transport system substrate-binding protein